MASAAVTYSSCNTSSMLLRTYLASTEAAVNPSASTGRTAFCGPSQPATGSHCSPTEKTRMRMTPNK
nr:hypothetical protein [Fodinicola feengrottensis]